MIKVIKRFGIYIANAYDYIESSIVSNPITVEYI